jgi:ABC-type dipeptide/oligopeptide/nickel transport system permease subunit
MPAAEFHTHPDVSEPGLPSSRGAWARLRRSPSFLVAAALVLAMLLLAALPQVFAGLFGNGDPRACDLAVSGLGPQTGHPFGFDMQGCDLFANVIHGARTSISVGLLVTLASLAIALLVGTLAGFYGGAVDGVLSRLIDVFMGFPFLLGALVVLIAFPSGSIWSVSLTLTLFGWPILTRLMRSTVLSVRELDYVTAARAIGATNLRLMLRHVIPNAVGPVVVLAALTVGTVIVAESSLTYLGVGLHSPAISWGLQLSTAQNDFQTHPHLLLFPSAFLSATVLSFILLGDSLREAFDPRSR